MMGGIKIKIILILSLLFAIATSRINLLKGQDPFLDGLYGGRAIFAGEIAEAPVAPEVFPANAIDHSFRRRPLVYRENLIAYPTTWSYASNDAFSNTLNSKNNKQYKFLQQPDGNAIKHTHKKMYNTPSAPGLQCQNTEFFNNARPLDEFNIHYPDIEYLNALYGAFRVPSGYPNYGYKYEISLPPHTGSAGIEAYNGEYVGNLNDIGNPNRNEVIDEGESPDQERFLHKSSGMEYQDQYELFVENNRKPSHDSKFKHTVNPDAHGYRDTSDTHRYGDQFTDGNMNSYSDKGYLQQSESQMGTNSNNQNFHGNNGYYAHEYNSDSSRYPVTHFGPPREALLGGAVRPADGYFGSNTMTYPFNQETEVRPNGHMEYKYIRTNPSYHFRYLGSPSDIPNQETEVISNGNMEFREVNDETSNIARSSDPEKPDEKSEEKPNDKEKENNDDKPNNNNESKEKPKEKGKKRKWYKKLLNFGRSGLPLIR